MLTTDQMSPYRKPLPSFTLVLTSGHHPFCPATIQLSSAIPPDFLMKTIDLRHDSSDDDFVENRDEIADSQTVFEEQPGTFDLVAEQTSTNSIQQNLLFLVRKLVTYKRKFATRKKDRMPALN
ncbi:hypothetical protein BYT27DRAFT_6382625 [Phlegmacium glaucopus]|nr:hypothetical protein BYT27DRAFT_6382625 [Phlegmacium glaucopus]